MAKHTHLPRSSHEQGLFGRQLGRLPLLADAGQEDSEAYQDKIRALFFFSGIEGISSAQQNFSEIETDQNDKREV